DRRLGANGTRQDGYADEARRHVGRGDRVNGLEATLEPRVAGLHDAPALCSDADLELAGDQAPDTATFVAVRERLASGSEVDAVAAHQILAGVVERERGRDEPTSGDTRDSAAVDPGACPPQELLAKGRRPPRPPDHPTPPH